MGIDLGLLPFKIRGQEGAYTACYWDVREEDGWNLRIVWVLGCWMWVEKNKGGRICLMGWWRNWAWSTCWLPLITLSNGQTRRARIARAVMEASELLLLDELLGEHFCLFPPSHCCPFYSIPEFPSSHPFPCCFLFISSLPFLPSPIFPPCLPSSLHPHFSWPSSLHHICSCSESLHSFSMFPCSHLFPWKYSSCFCLLPPFLSLSLSFFPSPPLSNFWHL